MKTRKARNKLHKSEFEYDNGVKVYVIDFGETLEVYPERRGDQFDVFIEQKGEIEDEINLTVEVDLDKYEMSYTSNNGIFTVQLTPNELVDVEEEDVAESGESTNSDETESKENSSSDEDSDE